ncbi:MAG: response regulator transcription factor [Roseivirga sp.]|nr:response regulator transcription factor [Roseivirga sp.]
MKYKALIVDDEPLAINVVVRYLEGFQDFEVVDTCQNALDAFNILDKKPVDVIFLDINMPTMSGLDLIRNLKNPPLVVITTAFREYAIDSFDLEVIDYLVKPFSLDRFMNTIGRVKKRLSPTTNTPALESTPETGEAQHVFFKVDKRMVKVMLDDIIYIESLKDYVRIKTTTESLINHNNLVSITEYLPDHKFIRIHRSYIIALDKVKAIEGNCVEIAGKLLPIGRNYQKTVKKLILNIDED